MVTKDKVWKRFSRYIRNKYANQYGYCSCVTCGAVGPWKQFDAGHYIDRRWEPTLFDERNVHPQCRVCNRMKDGNIENYENFLRMEYGEDICEELQELALSCQRPDLQSIDQKLKEHGF